MGIHHQAHTLVSMGANNTVPATNEDGFVEINAEEPEPAPAEVSFEPSVELAPAEVSFASGINNLHAQSQSDITFCNETLVPADDAMDNPDVEEVSLGDYTLHKCPSSRVHEPQPYLGRGAFATVYLGTHAPSGTKVAIKVIGIGNWFEKCRIKDGIKLLPPERLRYIESEIDAMNSLRGSCHPNVVRLLSVVRSTEGRYIYLVLEHCDGGTLKEYLARSGGSFDENTARRFLRHLAGGLYYIKTRPGNSQFVHRDLKPENFLLSDGTTNATLKIADFGFSRVPEEGNPMLESVVGTPYYMAPEIHIKQPYDDTVDLWAVGVVLFQSIFGRVPVVVSPQTPGACRDIKGLGQKLQTLQSYRDCLTGPAELARDSELSPECKDLLERLLQPNPAQRISFTEFMSHPFIDLATAFVDQGQHLVKEVEQKELAQRAFVLLKERLNELQEANKLMAAQHESKLAQMEENLALSAVEIQKKNKELRRAEEELELRKKDEQRAVSESIQAHQKVEALEARICELETSSSNIVVDAEEIVEGDRVLFIKKSGMDSQVAFEALCGRPGKYYLHKDCIMGGSEANDHMVGTVFMQEPSDNDCVMLFATLQ